MSGVAGCVFAVLLLLICVPRTPISPPSQSVCTCITSSRVHDCAASRVSFGLETKKANVPTPCSGPSSPIVRCRPCWWTIGAGGAACTVKARINLLVDQRVRGRVATVAMVNVLRSIVWLSRSG